MFSSFLYTKKERSRPSGFPHPFKINYRIYIKYFKNFFLEFLQIIWFNSLHLFLFRKEFWKTLEIFAWLWQTRFNWRVNSVLSVSRVYLSRMSSSFVIWCVQIVSLTELYSSTVHLYCWLLHSVQNIDF